MKMLLTIALILAQTFTFTGGPRSYETSFVHTPENPLSESSSWTNGTAAGGSPGSDWAAMRINPSGRAIGAMDGTQNYYGDATAVVAGTWAANQSAEGTVYRVVGNVNEIELRLRTTISAGSISGYEILFNNLSMDIVRWNGAIGDFTPLAWTGTGGGAVNGDVIRATMVGTTITVYKNSVQVATVTDATFSTGKPGLGIFVSAGPPTPDWTTDQSNLGFTHFKAMEL